MKKSLCIAVAGALLWVVPAGANDAQKWERITGFQSGVQKARTVAVTSDAAWRTLWAEHAAGIEDAPALPKADFANETVIAVFLGERTRGGHVIVLDARPNPKKNGELLVAFKEKIPAGGFSITLMNYPFEFRKFAKAYASVRFVATEEIVREDEKTSEAARKKKAKYLVRADHNIGRLTDSLNAMTVTKSVAVFDGGVSRYGAMTSVPAVTEAKTPIVKIGLPPPPGGGTKKQKQGKGLPPPPKKKRGKKLPPPPGKKLPPPPGRGKPLPPPPGQTLPRPIYPGGPLPSDNLRLRRAERTYSTYGKGYIGYWHDGTGYESQKGTVETRAADGDVAYILNLTSPRYQYYIEFYHEPKENVIYYTRTKKRLGSKSRRLVVAFDNRAQKPLLPWEIEKFVFSLNNTQVSLDSVNGSYDYDISYSFAANDRSTIDVTMTATTRRRTAPDARGVGAGLKVEGGRLVLVVTDKWAEYYEGENLEIAYVIRWDDGKWYRRDPVIASATTRSPLRKSAQKIIEIDIPASKRGTYYLESWSFKRANSEISTGRWISRGAGNKVTK